MSRVPHLLAVFVFVLLGVSALSSLAPDAEAQVGKDKKAKKDKWSQNLLLLMFQM